MAWYDPRDWANSLYGMGQNIFGHGGLVPPTRTGAVDEGRAGAQGSANAIRDRANGMDEDRARLQNALGQRSPWQTAPGVAKDPYQGDWRGLIAQLQGQAAGTGPSLAAQQYQNATNDNIAAQAAMARSGNTGAGVNARQAAIGAGRAQQGLAAGVAEARTREQMAASQALQGALQGAGGASFQRDALRAQLEGQANAGNQGAYLDMLAKQLGLSVEQIRALAQAGQLDLGAGQLGLEQNKLPTQGEKWLNVLGSILPLAGGGAG
jgi:hypothetical protein